MKPRAALALLLLVPLLALAACSATPRAESADPERAHVAAIHRSRCGACHVPVEPGTRSRDVLLAARARHEKRIRLSEADWQRMIDYLAW